MSIRIVGQRFFFSAKQSAMFVCQYLPWKLMSNAIGMAIIPPPQIAGNAVGLLRLFLHYKSPNFLTSQPGKLRILQST